MLVTCKIVTGDDSWIDAYETERKQQSIVRVFQGVVSQNIDDVQELKTQDRNVTYYEFGAVSSFS